MDELLLGSSACAPSTISSATTSILNTTISSQLNTDLDPCSNYASHPFNELMDCHYEDSSSLFDMENTTNFLSLTPSTPRIYRKNLIIWDWDDTIFPTFSFRTHQDRKDKLFMNKLRTLVSFTEEIFEAMIDRYGASNIVIVTNASANWIEKCLNVELIQSIYSHFASLLSKHRIATISASTPTITKQHPDDPHKWKEVVFRQLFSDHFQCEGDEQQSNHHHDDEEEEDDEQQSNHHHDDEEGDKLYALNALNQGKEEKNKNNKSDEDEDDGESNQNLDNFHHLEDQENEDLMAVKEVQCITSIGDSLCEYKASDRASKWMSNRVLNRVRLRPNPTIDEMVDQFKEIASMIDDFGASTDGMELDFTSLGSPTPSSSVSVSSHSATSVDL